MSFILFVSFEVFYDELTRQFSLKLKLRRCTSVFFWTIWTISIIFYFLSWHFWVYFVYLLDFVWRGTTAAVIIHAPHLFPHTVQPKSANKKVSEFITVTRAPLPLTCLMTYLSAYASVLAPHTLNSLFAQASFEPVNKHRKLLPASLYPTFSPLLMLNPPPRARQTPVWFTGLSSYLAQDDRLFPLLLGFSAMRGADVRAQHQGQLCCPWTTTTALHRFIGT